MGSQAISIPIIAKKKKKIMRIKKKLKEESILNQDFSSFERTTENT